MRVISRAESGLQPPRSRTLIATPTPRLWLHHTAGALDAGNNGVWWDDVRSIQDFHMRPVSEGGRGWSDIAYSFLVGGGMVFEGRGAGVAGGHTKGDNTRSHAICLIGDYTWMVPKQEDLRAIAWLMAHGKTQGWWGDLTGPHRDAPGASTACCGTNLIACIPDLRQMANNQEDDVTPDELKNAIREVLNEGTGKGHLTWRATNKKLYQLVFDRPSAAEIAEAVVAKLPPSSGGGVTKADVVAAVKQALKEGAG